MWNELKISHVFLILMENMGKNILKPVELPLLKKFNNVLTINLFQMQGFQII
jgi:hypothetical protein